MGLSEESDPCSPQRETFSTTETISSNSPEISAAKSTLDRNLLTRNLSYKLRGTSQISRNTVAGCRSSIPRSRYGWVSHTDRCPYNEVSPDRQMAKKQSQALQSVPNKLNSYMSQQTSKVARSPLEFTADLDAISDMDANEATCHKAAMDAVQFKNVGGIFVPRDKYAAGRFTKHCNYSPTPSWETIILRADGTSHRSQEPNAKGPHVTWSPFSGGVMMTDTRQNQSPCAMLPSTRLVKKDRVCLHRPLLLSRNTTVEHVGVNWKLSETTKKKSCNLNSEKHRGRVSKNVLPMTIGADKRGTSVSKTKWLIPTLREHDSSQVWFESLNFVKQQMAAKSG